jgi:hypothetical protein
MVIRFHSRVSDIFLLALQNKYLILRVGYVFNTEVRLSRFYLIDILLTHTGAPTPDIYAVYSNRLFLTFLDRMICVHIFLICIQSRKLLLCFLIVIWGKKKP